MSCSLLNAGRLRSLAADSVVHYTEEYAQAHREFAGRMWPLDPRRGNVRYNRWKFRAASDGPVEGLLLAIRGRQVVGQIGLTRMLARLNGQRVLVQWLCDLKVDPAFRIMGIGPMLLASAIDGEVVTLSDSPLAEASRMIHSFGFRELKGPHKLILALDATHMLSWKTPPKARLLIPLAACVIQPMLNWLARRLRGGNGSQVSPYRWDEVSELIARKQRDLDLPHIVHDRSFQEWRCRGVPGFSEEMRALRTPAGSYLVYGTRGRWLYVFDWAAVGFDETRALLTALYHVAKLAGVATISIMANTLQEQLLLRQLGFLLVPTPVKVFCYPPSRVPATVDRFHFCQYDAHADM